MLNVMQQKKLHYVLSKKGIELESSSDSSDMVTEFTDDDSFDDCNKESQHMKSLLDLMDESKKNEIKRNIAHAMERLMHIMHVKRIMKSQPYIRSEKQNQRVISFLKENKAFKKFPLLTNSDFRELSHHLTFRQVPEGTMLYDIQDKP